MKNAPIDWDDLRLFLDVARLGGLSAASRTTGLSPATLGRRITGLERRLGRPLFIRRQTGYQLTEAGEQLLEHAGEVETAMLGVTRWHEGAAGERLVRVSAGAWTSAFLAGNIGALWRAGEGVGITFLTAARKVDIGRRNADIGIRNARPTEQWLAGRQVGRVAYALYSGRSLANGVAAGLFVGVTGENADTPSARWLDAHHRDRIAVRGNDSMSARELIAASAGLGVLPCFVGDSDPRLVRVAEPIAELTSEQWLVTHHEERHTSEIRLVAQRIARLLIEHQKLFLGNTPVRAAPD